MGIKTFVERPVLSTVISVVIALLGIIGLATLPIEQYPDIAPPTVMVMTQYYGASAESVQKSVVAPLEEAINGVENMTYMTSNATNTGMAEIYVYFKQGTDPDMAAVNVQQLKMAKSQQREALLTFSQTVLTAGNEVNNALHNYQTLADKQSLYDSQVEALQRAAKATKLKMQYGSTTYLEVLTAQNSLLQAQFTQIANRMQTLQAVVTLYRALGGGSEYVE